MILFVLDDSEELCDHDRRAMPVHGIVADAVEYFLSIDVKS